MVACARLGLRTKYIGTVGDDERGRIQMESLLGTGINLDHVQVRRNCPNQIGVHHHRPHHRASARCCGGATIACGSTPEEITPEQITVRAPAAYRRARYPGGGARGAIARAPRHSGDGGRRHHLPGLRPRAAECRLPGGQLRIPGAVDERAGPVQRARDDPGGIRHAGGGDDAGGARRAGADGWKIPSTRRLSW